MKLLKYIVLLVSLVLTLSYSKNHTNENINSIEIETSIAFIDLNQQSIYWLDKNHQYLIDKQIFVLVLNTKNHKAVESLYKKYQKKLLIALAPEPTKYIELLLHQLNVKQLPFIYDRHNLN